jgi:hypothetical protein
VEVGDDVVGVVDAMSTGATERITPGKPPIVKTKMKPTAQSIGVSNGHRAAPHRGDPVEDLHAGRHATSMVAYMKKSWPVTGMPVANMWWAQTMNERIAIDAVA